MTVKIHSRMVATRYIAVHMQSSNLYLQGNSWMFTFYTIIWSFEHGELHIYFDNQNKQSLHTSCIYTEFREKNCLWHYNSFKQYVKLSNATYEWETIEKSKFRLKDMILKLNGQKNI